MADRTERFLSYVLTVAAVMIALVLVRREFFAKPPTGQMQSREPEYVNDWRAMLSQGRLIGDSGAVLHIVEFGDFECPFCAMFHERFKKLQGVYGDDVAMTYIHFPLGNHAQAAPAAQASECAATQGRFGPFVDLIFSQRDSLGVRSWVSFAGQSGVPDTVAFKSCMTDSVPSPLIEAGVKLGEQIQVRGTPTILVNGWRYPTPPTEAQLIAVMDALRAGVDPFKGK